MTEANKAELDLLPWSVRKRLEFIEFRLFWDGKVNRRDLTEHFNTSVPQASGDLARYQELAPTNVVYDRRAKEYVPSGTFKPAFISPDSSSYLTQLFAVGSGFLKPGESFISVIPQLGLLPTLTRTAEPTILKATVSAILKKRRLEIQYQSFSNTSQSSRHISPHSLATDGFRWHVRAFCHNDNIYKDFVLGRIVNILKTEESSEQLPPDVKWESQVRLVIAVNPQLPPAQVKAIEFDYDMKDGELVVNMRVCLAEYFLKRFGIGQDSELKAPHEQHIVLKNKEEVEKILGKKIFFR